MKKIICLFISLVLVFGISIPTYASQQSNLDTLLAPYIDAINNVNSEVGSTFFIPDKNKEQVYNNIKNMSLDEFKALLKAEYRSFTANSSLSTNLTSGEYTKDSIKVNDQLGSKYSPDSIIENIEQTYPIGQYNSSIYLDSTVFSGTGTIGTYTYRSINSYGTTWPAGYTGFHFGVSYGSYSLSSDSKNCTVNLTGYPVDPNGMALTVVLYASHTFNAG